MTSRSTIHRSLFFNMIVVSTCSCAIFAGLWIAYEYRRFYDDAENMRQVHVERQKGIMRDYVTDAVDYVEFMRRQVSARTRAEIRQRVNEAHDLSMRLWERYRDERSPEKIEYLICETLRAIRFNEGRGYYFATRLDGETLLMPSWPELEGTNIYDQEDSETKRVGLRMLDIAMNQGEDFCEYTWTEARDENDKHKKTSYIKLFKPLGFFIGSGEYEEDVERDIQREAIERISQIRYGPDGYLFAGQWDGLCLAGPDKGKNVLDAANAKRFPVVRRIIEKAKTDGGYVDYLMTRGEDGQSRPKVCYVEGVAEWQWFIGTGAYVDDIEGAINEMLAKRTETMRQVIRSIALILVMLWLGAYAISRRTAIRTKAALEALTGYLDEAAISEVEIKRPAKLGFSEFTRMAEAAELMIAKRLKATQALRENEERIRVLFDEAPDCVFVCDEKGKIREVNAQACRATGYAREELLSLHMTDIAVDAGSLEEFSKFHQNMALDQTETIETRHRRKDGSFYPVEVTITVFESPMGKYGLGIARDITVRLEQELKYAQVLKTAIDGFLVVDREGRVLEANPSTVKMTGWTMDELLGMSLHDLADGVTRELVVKCLAYVRKSGSWNYEGLARRMDGSSFDIEVNLTCHPSNPNEIYVFARDVTERIQAQAALCENEEILRLFIEHAPASIAMFDLDMRYLVASRRWIADSRLEGRDIIGKCHYDVVYGIPERWRTIHRQGMEGKVTRKDEDFYEREDGSLQWLMWEVRPWRRANGEIGGIIIFLQDITEVKLAENELRESEERHRKLIELSPSGVIVENAEGTILDVNPAMCRMSGYSREELVGSCVSIFNPNSAALIQQTNNQILNGEEFEHEVVNHQKDGSVCRLELRETAFPLANGEMGILVIANDITDRVRGEARMAAELRLADFASDHGSGDLLRAFLDETEALTGSDTGFFHFIDSSQEHLSLQAWSTNTTENMCRVDEVGGHYPISEAGIWADCIRQGKPLIHNDYAAIAHLTQLPEGHVPVVRELVTPVIRAKKFVAIMGVGNKRTDYTEDDVETVQRLADLAWETVVRKKAEEALRENENRFRKILDRMEAIPIQGYDELRRVIYWNVASEKVYGYSKAEAMGRNLEDLIIPDAMREQTIAAVENWLERGVPIPSGESMLRDKHGGPVPVYSSHMLHSGPLGQREMYCIDIDLRQLRQAEEERGRLMSAIEQADEIFVITDARGVIQYVNPAFESVTGYSRAEALGRNSNILKSGHQDVSFYRDMWETVLGGETWRGQFVNKKKDGMLFTEDAIISPVRNAVGEIVNLIAVKRDITEKIRLETQYHQAQKMEVIGQLTGGVAHDFNNLLQVINGCTEMAMLDLPSGHASFSMLEEVARAGARAARLVSQLLAFSRRQIMRPETLDLNDAVTELTKTLVRLIGEHIHLVWRPGPCEGKIHADRSMIEQVLMNLCINARDAMSEGGTLTIKTDEVTFDKEFCARHAWAQPGRFIHLSVADEGCGMESSILDHVFEPFFTTKEVGRGTGLGLATVYGVIKQHEGLITVESERDRGTIFKLYWPISDLEEEDEPEAVEIETCGGDETVLLAEDNDMVRDMAVEILRRGGYSVLTVGNGLEAIEKFKLHSSSIDLAIFDVLMPHMGGREAYNRIQELKPGLKTLFISGYNEDAVHTNFVLDEGLSLLEKPFSVNALLEAVRNILDAEPQ